MPTKDPGANLIFGDERKSQQVDPGNCVIRDGKGQFCLKTKLLKLLYLFDIEWFRVHGETYTGFDWIYHLLGPWTANYDPLLEGLLANQIISTRKSSPGFDAELFETHEKVDLDRLFDSYKDEFLLKGVLNTWAEKSTPEILDYVYFGTEPMSKAQRGEALDFATVEKEAIPEYKRSSSGATKKQIKAVRERLLERQQDRGGERQFTPPRYDEEYFAFIEQLEAMN